MQIGQLVAKLTDQLVTKHSVTNKTLRPQFCHSRSSRLEQSAGWTASSRHCYWNIQKETEEVSVRHTIELLVHLQHCLVANLRSINVLNNNNNNLEQCFVAFLSLLYQHSVLLQERTQEQAEILDKVLFLIAAAFVRITQIRRRRQHLQHNAFYTVHQKHPRHYRF